MQTRRAFTREALGSLLTFSLLETLWQQNLFGDEIKPLAARWVADLNQLGREVKDQSLAQLEWQAKVEELFAQVDLPDLLRLIDFEKLAAGTQFAEKGARSLRFEFAEVAGIPTQWTFGRQIFALNQGRSVVPHGHNNMATAFLVLKGELHGRHYDRLENEADHYLIKPTIDRKFTAGEYSTVSDYKDNIHWFQALEDGAFIFNIHVMNIDTGNGEATGRLYLDPLGEKLEGGLIRARKIDHDEAERLYG